MLIVLTKSRHSFSRKHLVPKHISWVHNDGVPYEPNFAPVSIVLAPPLSVRNQVLHRDFRLTKNWNSDALDAFLVKHGSTKRAWQRAYKVGTDDNHVVKATMQESKTTVRQTMSFLGPDLQRAPPANLQASDVSSIMS